MDFTLTTPHYLVMGILFLVGLATGFGLAFQKVKEALTLKKENLKVLCWMSQSGKMKIDEEGSKAPRLLHLANLSRYPVFDITIDFKNEDDDKSGKIYLEALLPSQEELFPVTEWSNLNKPVFKRARITSYSFIDFEGQRWERKITKGKDAFRKVKQLSPKALGVEVRQVRLPEYKDPVLLYLPPAKPQESAKPPKRGRGKK